MVEVNLFTLRAVYLENGESKPAFSGRKNPALFIIKVLPPQHGVFARFYTYSNARARRVSNPVKWYYIYDCSNVSKLLVACCSYIILLLLFPTPLQSCINSFFGSSIPTSLFILKMFFRSIFVQYSKRCSKNIRDGSKIKITRTWRYN